MTPRAPVVVIGVGAEMRGDDGLGPAAASVVARRVADDPGIEVAWTDGEPARLIDTWRDRRLAVVIDAVRTGAPAGTPHRLDPVDGVSTALGRPSASTHHAGLAEALALGRVLERLPDRLVVLGLEPGDTGLGAGLSAPVAAAMPHLVDAVVEEVGG